MTRKKQRRKVVRRIFKALRRFGYKGGLPLGMVQRIARHALDVWPDCHAEGVTLPELESADLIGVRPEHEDCYYALVGEVAVPRFADDGFDSHVFMGHFWPAGFWDGI